MPPEDDDNEDAPEVPPLLVEEEAPLAPDEEVAPELELPPLALPEDDDEEDPPPLDEELLLSDEPPEQAPTARQHAANTAIPFVDLRMAPSLRPARPLLQPGRTLTHCVRGGHGWTDGRAAPKMRCMSEVRWGSDTQTAKADERRQTEKSDAEKRQSKAAFEQRLNQERVGKQETAKTSQAEKQTQTTAKETKAGENKESERAQQSGRKEGEKKVAKKSGKENQVLAHVRQNATHGRLADRRLLGQQGNALQKEMEQAAGKSQEGKEQLGTKREAGLSSNKAQETGRSKDMDKVDRTKDKDAQEVKEEKRTETKGEAQAAAQGAAAAATGDPSGVAVNQDGKQNSGGKQQGGQQQAEEAQNAKAPSQSSIQRANKASEIQKLCEKLLDNFYMGAAPDGSAMMRMELKEGVLAGLVIDLKVNDKRQITLTLSGGNKEAIDFVTSSRGELARSLSRKGLELKSVDAV